MAPLPTVVDILKTNPELLLLVAILARVGRAYQAQLTWPEYRTAHRFKRGVFPLLEATTLGDAILLVSQKGGRDDGEFVETVPAGVRYVVRQLQQAGGSLHLLNSVKRRPDTHGDPLSAAHLVWTVDDSQVEAYIFRNEDGTVDVYAHTEASVDHPLAHLTTTQTDGDGHGVIPELTPA